MTVIIMSKNWVYFVTSSIFLLEMELMRITSGNVPEGSNIYTHGDAPIQVFSIHSLQGHLTPIHLDLTKLPHVNFPKMSAQHDVANDVITHRGNQTVHSCYGPNLIARGREHHVHLHSQSKKTRDEANNRHHHNKDDNDVNDDNNNNDNETIDNDDDNNSNSSDSIILRLLQQHFHGSKNGQRRRHRRHAEKDDENHSDNNHNQKKGKDGHTHRPQSPQAIGYEVETVLVFDYRLFVSSIVSPSRNPWEAIPHSPAAVAHRFQEANNNDAGLATLAMTQYYANLMRAVNRRYESVSDAASSVTIVPTVFIFSTQASASPWTENNKDGNIVLGNSALTAFNAYANTLSDSGVFYDHAALMTGYDMYTDNRRTNLLGLAYVFSVCGFQATSLNEEYFTEQTANTVAHEIGHSLGASHDGNGNDCSTGTFYVMAPTSALPTTPNLGGNPWKFSSCSASIFKSFLSTPDADCVLSVNSRTRTDFNPFLVQEWGQTVPADQQCQMRYGPNSRFCREDFFDSDLSFNDMCYNMKCLNPNTGQCVLQPAHDGTSCGNRKWCIKGQCVVSAQAPARSENCPQLNDPSRTCTSVSNCEDPDDRRIYCCDLCNLRPPDPSPSPSLPPAGILSSLEDDDMFPNNFLQDDEYDYNHNAMS